MEKIPYGVYSNELRKEAVKLVTESGLSIPGSRKKIIDPRINGTELGKDA